MSNDQDGDGGLYDAVAQTPKKHLRSAVEKVDGLSPEDESALERGGKLALRGTKRRIARASLWFAFVLCVVAAIAIMSGVGALSYAYIADIIAKGQAGEAVSTILGFLLGIFTTLAVEFLWYLSTRAKRNG